MPTKDYKESLFEDLQDPEFAVAYLNAALEESSSDVFLLHLRDVAEAWGGLGKLAVETRLAREALYRMLSENGNPQLSSLEKILHALGLRLAVARAVSED
jgi:probable addiction module antidote protein